MNSGPYWQGFAKNFRGELLWCEIYPPEDGYVAIYVSDELADNIESLEDLEEYLEAFYDTHDDFRNNTPKTAEEVWPE